MTTKSAGKRSYWAFISIAVGTVLAILSIILTSYGSLWNFLGVPRDVRSSQALGLAIVFMNLGFLIAFYYQQEGLKQDVVESQVNQVAHILNSIPSGGLYSYYSGDEAMRLVAAMFPHSKSALNTRIRGGKTPNPTSNKGFEEWDASLRSSVREGMTFKEVVSSGNTNLVRDRLRTTKGGSGLYEASIVNSSLASFMNFIVLEHLGGAKEVWFGWIAAKGSGVEGTVIRTSDPRIVTLFEQWHRDLFSAGRLVAEEARLT
jgi:hypothetical protein